MNILAFLSIIILVITFITLIFGILAYFLYKSREKKLKENSSYEEVLKAEKDEYIYFEK